MYNQLIEQLQNTDVSANQTRGHEQTFSKSLFPCEPSSPTGLVLNTTSHKNFKPIVVKANKELVVNGDFPPSIRLVAGNMQNERSQPGLFEIGEQKIYTRI